jgi:hypothetical protein
MSAKTEIYNILVNNADLNSRLARSNIKGLEALPAIYDSWPDENAKMPYMVLSWRFPQGANHWAQVAALVDIDIFTNEQDTQEAEAIKDICLEALAWQRIRTETEGIISIYWGGTDGELQEPEPQIVHWNVNFLVKFWRQKMIAAITNKI